jgi:uroporphyrinogen decarboxylase
MNSRERVLAALNHKEPDRVPLDMGSIQSGIHIKAYERLLEHLDIQDENIQYYDFGQQLAVPCEALLKRFHIDTRYLRPIDSIKPRNYQPERVDKYVGNYDALGVFWGNFASKPLNEILYYDPVIHPLQNMKSIEEIHSYSWPKKMDIPKFEDLRKTGEMLRKTDYAISTHVLGCVWEYTTFMFGFVTALRNMRTKPELLKATMGHLLEYWMSLSENFLKNLGKYVDIVCVNGDLAEQAGPIMSDKMYSELIKPYEAKFSAHIHNLADVKINYHSCGSTPQFIPHFIDIGYDAHNPVQISANDMEPCSLKRRFGDKISFWGGLCNTQKTLPFGTLEEIRNEVRTNLECFKPGGGYIAANIHNITAEVPPENIVAMFDAAIEFGDY